MTSLRVVKFSTGYFKSRKFGVSKYFDAVSRTQGTENLTLKVCSKYFGQTFEIACKILRSDMALSVRQEAAVSTVIKPLS